MSEPYLSVIPSDAPAGHHALFAARVAHWPFSRLAEHVWVDRDDEFKIQLQLLDRHLRFIMALHPGAAAVALGRRLTFELRYFHRPGEKLVECVLLGKAFDAESAAGARRAVLELWEIASTATPVGYELTPARTEAEFQAWSGADLARHAAEQKQWAEIRRPAEFLLWTDENQAARYLPIVYPYRWEASGWDVVWAALARSETPALISVSLRPTEIGQDDERVLSALLADLQEVAEAATLPLSRRAAEAVDWYLNYVRGLRVAYSVHLSVLGAPALRYPVRSAVSGPAWNLEGGAPGSHALHADILEPAAEEWPAAQLNFDLLEQAPWGASPWGRARLLPIFERLRFLVDPAGALCAFRLPVLPPAGFPGVAVGQEIHLGS